MQAGLRRVLKKKSSNSVTCLYIITGLLFPLWKNLQFRKYFELNFRPTPRGDLSLSRNHIRRYQRSLTHSEFTELLSLQRTQSQRGLQRSRAQCQFIGGYGWVLHSVSAQHQRRLRRWLSGVFRGSSNRLHAKDGRKMGLIGAAPWFDLWAVRFWSEATSTPPDPLRSSPLMRSLHFRTFQLREGRRAQEFHYLMWPHYCAPSICVPKFSGGLAVCVLVCFIWPILWNRYGPCVSWRADQGARTRNMDRQSAISPCPPQENLRWLDPHLNYVMR